MHHDHRFEVRAFWDDEAKVWVATSDDVPGLATEAGSMDDLLRKLRVMVPELLELNGVIPSEHEETPFQVVTLMSASASGHA